MDVMEGHLLPPSIVSGPAAEILVLHGGGEVLSGDEDGGKGRGHLGAESVQEVLRFGPEGGDDGVVRILVAGAIHVVVFEDVVAHAVYAEAGAGELGLVEGRPDG